MDCYQACLATITMAGMTSTILAGCSAVSAIDSAACCFLKYPKDRFFCKSFTLHPFHLFGEALT